MKRLLLILLPWMVMEAGAQSLRPAAVQMTHHKEAQAYREGNECYVTPVVLSQWGWSYNFVANEATIQMDSKVAKVTAKTLENKMLLPLSDILRQVGASGAWEPDRDIFLITAQAKSISVKNGQLKVESSLPITAVQSNLNAPNRLQIDLQGLRLGTGCKLELTGGARAAQFSSNVVRVTIYTDTRATTTPSEPSKSFTLRYDIPVAPVNPNAPPKVDPPVISKPPVQENRGGNQQQVSVYTDAGPIALLNETETTAKFFMPLANTLAKPPQFTKVSPTEFEILVPNGHYIAPPAPLNSPSITAFEPVESEEGLLLKVRMSRPMGVTFNYAKEGITFSLIKPAVGNGKLAGKTVVVDPGHGGHDPGAKAPDGSVSEKTLTLAVGKLLASELAAQGATVIMTRDTDVFISLQERSNIANRNKADFFISVHINSNSVANKISGSISFYHKNDPIGELLATCIENEMKKVSKLPSVGVWSDTRIYKQSGFAVLRGSKMPAVLLELGFINTDKDRKRLREEEYQKAIAKAITQGIKEYLGDGN